MPAKFHWCSSKNTSVSLAGSPHSTNGRDIIMPLNACYQSDLGADVNTDTALCKLISRNKMRASKIFPSSRWWQVSVYRGRIRLTCCLSLRSHVRLQVLDTAAAAAAHKRLSVGWFDLMFDNARLQIPKDHMISANTQNRQKFNGFFKVHMMNIL